MCDYSLSYLESRPAVVGDKLTTSSFNHYTHGFASVEGKSDVPVCMLPGTEVAFDAEITSTASHFGLEGLEGKTGPVRKHGFNTAVFAKINENNPHTHHDALEFPDGTTVLVNELIAGQRATVLQLPAEKQPEKPQSGAEDVSSKTVEVV